MKDTFFFLFVIVVCLVGWAVYSIYEFIHDWIWPPQYNVSLSWCDPWTGKSLGHMKLDLDRPTVLQMFHDQPWCVDCFPVKIKHREVVALASGITLDLNRYDYWVTVSRAA